MTVRIYLSFHDNNKYRKLLAANFPEVKTFLNRVKWFKIIHVYILALLAFLFGFLNGELLEIGVLSPSYNIFMKMLDVNYIANLLSGKLNLNSLSDDMIGFNLAMIYTSFLNLSFLVVIYFLSLWNVLLKLMHMLPIRIRETGYTTGKTLIVYESGWFFMGVIIGLNYIMYRLLFYYLSKFSIINDGFSFNLSYFTGIYTNLSSNLMYPEFHICMYIIGISANIILIFMLYYITKMITERIIELITHLYENKFPDVKITAGNGEIEGQLKDIRNKSLIALSGSNELKIIPWNKIEILNARLVKETEQFIIKK